MHEKAKKTEEHMSKNPRAKCADKKKKKKKKEPKNEHILCKHVMDGNACSYLSIRAKNAYKQAHKSELNISIGL
jgi:hypothetical protein